MNYIVDFQGFWDDANNFIFKEISIQGIENDKLIGIREQFLFLPPFDFRHLSEKKKKQVYWLQRNKHGFSWNCGIQDYEEIHEIFIKLTGVKCIYVKGLEKKNILERELKQYTKIINIECLKCPSLKILQQSAYTVDCPYKHFSQNCAANNVYHISEWVLKYWNNECKEHCERTKRINCWNCLSEI